MAHDESELDALKEQLYSRTDQPHRGFRRFRSGLQSAGVQEDWQRSPEAAVPIMSNQHLHNRIFKLVFIASIVFCAAALAYSAFFFFGNSNVISSNNINVIVDGPAIIDAGKPLALSVTVENRNATPLQLADLLVDYPDGTKSVADLNTDLPRDRQSLGDIAPGASVTKQVQAVLFGQETEQKPLKLTVEYRVPGSNAIFYKEKDIVVTIGSAPLSLSISAVDEISSNQVVQLEVVVTSNSTAPLQNLLLSAEYPFGFTFTSSDPQSAYSNNLWDIGDLPPGGKRTIRVQGTLTGEDNDQRAFRFAVGSKSATDAHTISATFLTASHQVTIQKPFIGVNLALNGDTTKQVVITKSGAVRGDITWTNNLPVSVSNLSIEAKLSGAVLDPSSVSVLDGFYRSADNTIVWNSQTLPAFSSVEPGTQGALQFSFAPLSLGSGGSSLRNPALTINLTVKGNRLGDTNVAEQVTSAIERTAVFATKLLLSSAATHAGGPFSNSGPVPPKANTETGYTVTWSLSNSSNPIVHAKVVATLPPYVRFVQAVDSSVTFNPIGGTVTWNAGTIPAGTGFGVSPRSTQFQVIFLPSVTQVGTTPVLVNTATVTGDDQFAQSQVTSTAPAATIDITTDPAYKAGDDVVR